MLDFLLIVSFTNEQENPIYYEAVAVEPISWDRLEGGTLQFTFSPLDVSK